MEKLFNFRIYNNCFIIEFINSKTNQKINQSKLKLLTVLFTEGFMVCPIGFLAFFATIKNHFTCSTRLESVLGGFSFMAETAVREWSMASFHSFSTSSLGNMKFRKCFLHCLLMTETLRNRILEEWGKWSILIYC